MMTNLEQGMGRLKIWGTVGRKVDMEKRREPLERRDRGQRGGAWSVLGVWLKAADCIGGAGEEPKKAGWSRGASRACPGPGQRGGVGSGACPGWTRAVVQPSGPC